MRDWWERLVGTLRTQKALPILGIVLGVFLLILFFWLFGGSSLQTTETSTAPAASGGVAEMLFGVLWRLALVIGLIYLFFAILRRWQSGKTRIGKKRLHIIESLHLTPRQTIHLIQVGSRSFVVGSTDQAMSLLAEMEPEDIEIVTQNPDQGQVFPSLLQQALSNPAKLFQRKPGDPESLQSRKATDKTGT